MQKLPRAFFKQNVVALAPDVEPVERADRRFRLALRISKGREIVPAEKHERSRVHGLGIEAWLHPPGASALDGQRGAAIDDAIEIMAGACAAPGVEIRAHALGADDGHGMGMKQRVEALAEPERLPVALKAERPGR